MTPPAAVPCAPGSLAGDVRERGGNLAAIGAVPTEAASNDADIPAVLLFRDAGPGGGEGSGQAQLDGFADRLQLDPNQCQNPLALASAAGTQPIRSGNILVRDVQP